MIDWANYSPPLYLQGAHLQTIIPSVFRKIVLSPTKCELIPTPDDDFLEIDWHFAAHKKSKICAIISHGLEGNSTRQYIIGMVKALKSLGVDSCAWNFRSCGTKPNKQIKFYHSGATYDLDTVVQHCVATGYDQIYLVGFSLGGNLTLKYLGETQRHPMIKGAIGYSVPLALDSSSAKIDLPTNFIYQQRFLRSLKKKIIEKGKTYPELLKMANLGKITNLRSFDDAYTSKLHGFIDAKDYYAKNSSIIFVKNIEVQTLIVNAKNDPFLSDECFPTQLQYDHKFVKLYCPAQGGHCGFWQKNKKELLWSELIAIEFIKNLIDDNR